jgi:DNA segregation ATPase FtsK/SpoIIIE-like protein
MSDTEHMQGAQSDDPLYRLLVPLLPGLGRFRVAAIQRSFMIGYNRASRLMERLEKEGHIKEVPDERGGYFVATPRAA